ncbi:hypothetical protein A2W67_00205 [Candidatus Nomurabacteria bacterium RIFCSPLOWO2_02_40_28]|uniref:Uncharacterized protein n=2 Tax=Candidatus Nomuraibacteriota TaxID=1752729 RepID=A0A837HVG4_9BACT|nr:MAG: hypothetical protein UT27_C0009G0023 [Candidatus Nomurabacteria bacterium GW2011_GWD2_39_12]KKR20229.1 MAG: hypothetical protein UT51_C0006G0023 [Candidatus Nomurabacteria bacterium GW2011_GWC2_39_41]KKR36685.1 MAG: hypothetical protein UT70_C0007G0023 [Candidatus Nomurabacteria bacterium GW2011_GWE2_40_10]KKR38126.1 MAG: hypothetical protein UT73_C0006G0023 [Candidatus Nomurabacteria bacterium GW2011_GWB1_40_11]KKR39730.1 MAG: hypothetical protein UT74_C0006G0023 [Parcubacteria group b
MNKKKVGLVVGSFAALMHLVWGVFIALGFAQPWMDFVYKMHFLNNPFTVMPFDLMRILGLVVIAFVMGYIVGYVFAVLWHKLHN